MRMFPAGVEITGEEEHPSKDSGCVVMCQECMESNQKWPVLNHNNSDSLQQKTEKHCNFANAENENFMENMNQTLL